MRFPVFVSILLMLLPGVVLEIERAEAVDRGSLGTISPDTSPIQKTFPGPTPNPSGRRNLYAQVRQAECRQVPNCDTHEFRVRVPNPNPEIHGIRVTLSWPEPASAVNLDMWVWADDDSPVFGPAYVAADTTTQNPEVADAGEPETATYWITVFNAGGVNSRYTLKLEWTALTDLGPDYARPKRGGTTTSQERPRFLDHRDIRAGTAESLDEPTPTLSPMKVPGPDGELTEQMLPVLVSGRERAAPRQGLGPMLITLITVLVMAGVGLATFFVLRRRRRAAEA